MFLLLMHLILICKVVILCDIVVPDAFKDAINVVISFNNVAFYTFNDDRYSAILFEYAGPDLKIILK